MSRRLIRGMLAAVCVLIGMMAVWPAFAESANTAPVILLNGQPVKKAVLNLSAGNQMQFTSNVPVTWTSSKTYRAEINKNGLLTCKSSSTVVVTAKAANGKKATCEVQMIRLATGITISGPKELAAGKSGTLKATVLPENAKNRKVTWRSSDEKVVSVNSSGRITAKSVSGVRSAVITATAADGSGVVARHTVTVRPAAKTVSILSAGKQVKEIVLDLSSGNLTAQLNAQIEPSSASQAVTWKSSSSRLKVSSNGLITGLKEGSATITATAADGTGRKATVKVKIVRMVTGIKITGENSMMAGKSLKLKATVLPKNASSDKLKWESSNTSVATVDKYGKVKAQKVSAKKSVIITARAQDGSGVVAQYKITVTPRVETLKITRGGQPVTKTITVDLASNPTIDLNTLIQPADANQKVKWSSNSSRATVNQNGLVTGKKTGEVRITAKAEDGSDKKASVTISFVNMVKKIRITGDTQLTGGRSGELETVFEPAKPTNKKVVWESSNPAVLTVNKYGDIKAAKVTARQKVTVYAKAQDGSGVVGSVVVTVTPRASSVSIRKNGVSIQTAGIDLGGNRVLRLTAKVGPNDAQQTVKWTTSDKKRATVDQNGVVTGLKAGSVTITATATDGTGVKAQVKINVGTMVRQVKISGPKQVSTGGKIQLNASISPAGATNKEIVWSSSNESAATVNKSGRVTGGVVDVPTQVKIRATAKDGGGAIGEYTVQVLPIVRSITISRTDANMPGALLLNPNGAKAKLSATAYPAAAQQQVKWSSSDEDIVTVDAKGNVVSHRAGRTTIVARATDGSGVKAVLWVGVGNLSEYPYYFEVDRTNQVVRVYERGADNTYSKLIKRMICSTGKTYTPGLDETLHSLHGSRMVWMDGVAIYATRIKGHFLFHSVIYKTKNMGNLDAAAYRKLGTKASGGCVRLLAGDAKWIYDNVPKGCFVNFVAGPRDVSESSAAKLPPLKSGRWDPTNPNPNNPDFDPTYTSNVK